MKSGISATLLKCPYLLEPPIGVEQTTYRLRIERSTNRARAACLGVSRITEYTFPLVVMSSFALSRAVVVQIAFTEGEADVADPQQRTVQRPRVFYRRELEANPLVIAKP